MPACMTASSGVPARVIGGLGALRAIETAVALHFAYYNFCRVYSSLKITPPWKRALPTTFGRLPNCLQPPRIQNPLEKRCHRLYAK